MNLAEFEPILARPALDPRRSFAHGSYATTTQRLLEATRMGPGVLVLTGAAGSGKTTLIAGLAARLEQAGHCVERVASPRMDTEDLLRVVGFALGLQAQRSSRAGLMWEPEHRDSAQCPSDRPAILIIDEAQDLAPAVLQQLCRLGVLDGGQGVNLQILLSGRDGLWRLLEQPEHAEIQRRILASCRLGPLALEEMRGYATHALGIAGWTGYPVIGADALDLIHMRTGGVPRLITLTLGHLLLDGRLAGARWLGTREVEAVLSHLGQDHPQLLAERSGSPSSAEGVVRHPLVTPSTTGMPGVVGQGKRAIEGRGSGLGSLRVGMALEAFVSGFQGLTRWDWRWVLTGLSAAVAVAYLIAFDLVGDGAKRDEPPTLAAQDRGKGYTVVPEGEVEPPGAESGRMALEPLLAPAPLVPEPRNRAPAGEGAGRGQLSPVEQGASPQGAEVTAAERQEADAGSPGEDVGLVAQTAEPSSPATPQGVEEGQAARKAEVAQILERAERAVASDRLMVPADDNAYGYYRAVLALDPGNPQARAGVGRIVTRYQGLAQERLRKGDLSGARRFASRGLALSPRDPELLAIKRKATRPKAAKPEHGEPVLLARLESWLRSGRSDRSLFLDQ